MKPKRAARLAPSLFAGLVTLAALGLGGCGEPEAHSSAHATRGYLLISIDTLRADHLGTYGYHRPTSPFLDGLAERGTLFERAVVQLPGTLPSHMSIFTGLYPAEHGVYPPNAVLSPEIETLPEAFRRAGFRTAGVAEGGYMAGRYGFDRGFDEWTESGSLETTLDTARGYLDNFGDQDPFFLFVHTYSVHDPYTPPPPYDGLFWEGEPPAGAFPPTGPNLSEVNKGERQIDAQTVSYFEALYDGGIRHMDEALREFFADLENRGLLEDLTVVITSDHGEEFFEHGKMVHEQIYDENLHVPLLVVHPRLGNNRRVPEIVESVDLAPTLRELAGLAPAEASGRSLLPLLRGDAADWKTEGYAEGFTTPSRALYRQSDGTDTLHHMILYSPVAPREGKAMWAQGTELVVDTTQTSLRFRARSYHVPRQLEVSADGEPLTTLFLTGAWASYNLELPDKEGGATRLRLATDECLSPSALGESRDRRCLAFQVSDFPADRGELFDVLEDPKETHDLSGTAGELYGTMVRSLRSREFVLRAPVDEQPLDSELEERLKSLGYL